MPNNKNNIFYFFLISSIVIVFDQITKHIINGNLKSLINSDLILFSIDYVKNYGAAFNLFSGSRIFLSLVSILTTIALLYIILNKKDIKTYDFISYSFIFGGTIGNGLDRIINGYVIDFIKLKFINFPIFNIADISINIGFILIIYNFIKYKKT